MTHNGYRLLVHTSDGPGRREVRTLRNLIAELDVALDGAMRHCIDKYEDTVKPGWLEGMHYFFTQRNLLRAAASAFLWDEDDMPSYREMRDDQPAAVLLLGQLAGQSGLTFSYNLPDGSVYEISAARYYPEGF